MAVRGTSYEWTLAELEQDLRDIREHMHHLNIWASESTWPHELAERRAMRDEAADEIRRLHNLRAELRAALDADVESP